MTIPEFFALCEINNNNLYLPSRDVVELAPKVYSKEVRQPLLDLGGKWSQSFQCWEFDFDPTPRIQEIINGKKTKLSSKFHFFETPVELAGAMFQFCEEAGIKWWEMLNLETAECLEPEAGRGRLIQRLHINGFKKISYYELMPENREVLKDVFSYHKITPTYLGEDFMKGAKADFDLILANPPFRDDEKHIKQMFKVSKPGGIILTLAGPKIYTSEKFEQFLTENAGKWMMRELTADKDNPIFEGTNIGCTLIAAQKKKIEEPNQERSVATQALSLF